MQAGSAQDGGDRWPWLDRIASCLGTSIEQNLEMGKVGLLGGHQPERSVLLPVAHFQLYRSLRQPPPKD